MFQQAIIFDEYGSKYAEVVAPILEHHLGLPRFDVPDWKADQ